MHALRTNTHIQTYKHTNIQSYIHACMHACIHTHIHTYMHTYIHTYTHTYIYINKSVREALQRYGRYGRYGRYERYRRAGRFRPTWQGVPQPTATFADAALAANLAANLAMAGGPVARLAGSGQPGKGSPSLLRDLLMRLWQQISQ